jgi:hypothetical protein
MLPARVGTFGWNEMKSGATTTSTASTVASEGNIRQVVEACQQWKRDPSIVNFGDVVRAGEALLTSQQDWTTKFGVSAGTKTRWKLGEAQPHRLVQEKVVTDLQEIAEKLAVAGADRQQQILREEIVGPAGQQWGLKNLFAWPWS